MCRKKQFKNLTFFLLQLLLAQEELSQSTAELLDKTDKLTLTQTQQGRLQEEVTSLMHQITHLTSHRYVRFSLKNIKLY